MTVIPTDRKPRIAFLIPTHDRVPWEFMFDFANMYSYSAIALGDTFDFALHVVPGTYVHKARQQLLDEAYALDYDYVLWLDSDHRFPKDALVRLLAHDEAIVGINYSTRGIPPKFVAIKRCFFEATEFDDPRWFIPREDGLEAKGCATMEDSFGLEEVEALGFGLVLMKRAVMESLPKDRPSFFFRYSADGKIHLGEDVWFCMLARRAGWKIYIDHDLSKECAHVGAFEFRLDHAQAMVEFAEEEEQDGTEHIRRAEDGDSELAESE